MALSLDFYSWHRADAQQWLSCRERFAHAWLVHGVPGIGKQQFAIAGAASLLCENPQQGLACGQCQSCHWLLNGYHPDFQLLCPESLTVTNQVDNKKPTAASGKKPSEEIRIEQLRALQTWFTTTSHQGGWRVVVIYPASALNLVSANALLKILEEPPAHTVFILVAATPDQLLPTLVSRCRRLALPVPPQTESLLWLKEQGVEQAPDWLAAVSQAPLRAYEQFSLASRPYPEWLLQFINLAKLKQANPDVGAISDTLSGLPTVEWLDVLQRLLFDLSLQQKNLPVHYYPGLSRYIADMAQHSLPQTVSDASKWLIEQRQLASHPLNAKLHCHQVLQRLLLSL